MDEDAYWADWRRQARLILEPLEHAASQFATEAQRLIPLESLEWTTWEQRRFLGFWRLGKSSNRRRVWLLCHHVPPDEYGYNGVTGMYVESGAQVLIGMPPLRITSLTDAELDELVDETGNATIDDEHSLRLGIPFPFPSVEFGLDCLARWAHDAGASMTRVVDGARRA